MMRDALRRVALLVGWRDAGTYAMHARTRTQFPQHHRIVRRIVANCVWVIAS